MKTLKILSYAVNGSGLGHLTRLLALNRWLERLVLASGVTPQQCFLTTSEADTLVWQQGFASFKLPSKTAIKAGRIPIEEYLRMARQWVLGAINLWQPDVLIVDTFPNGSFHELVSGLEGIRQRVFVHRELKDSFANHQSFQAMLPLYHQILVPHMRDEGTPQVPPSLHARMTFTGPMLLREPYELLARPDARAQLGIASDAFAIYLSAGGGGDETAEGTLFDLLEALESDPSIHVVVGAGPLYRGRVKRGPRLTWLTGYDTGALLKGMDLAISASGYNSFTELLSAGVPTVFYAQDKVADVQEERVARAVRAGAACCIPHPIPKPALMDVLTRLRAPAEREALSKAAQAFIPSNGARLAAARILSAVLPAENVEEALELVTPSLLSSLHARGLSLDEGLKAARLLGAASTRSERRLQRLLVEDTLAAQPLPSAPTSVSASSAPLQAALQRRFPDQLDGEALSETVLLWLTRWKDVGQVQLASTLLELFLRRSRLQHLAELPEDLHHTALQLIQALVAFSDPKAASLALQALPRASDGIEVLAPAVAHLEAGRAAGKSLYLLLAEIGGSHALR